MAICKPKPTLRSPLNAAAQKAQRHGLWGRARAALLVLLAAVAGPALAFDLQFNSVIDVDPAPTSGVLQYTVQVENSGFTNATDVRTVFAIPDGATVEGGALALPSAGNANCSQSGAFVVCTHGDMSGTGGGAGTPPIVFVLRFRAPAVLPSPPNVRLRGAIGRGAPPLGSAQADPAPLFASGSSFWIGDTNENNNAQAPLQQTTLENNADLSVAVAASANPVVSGARLTYLVTVTNNGPTSNPTTGVRVLSTLPAGATFVGGSASGAGWTFSGPSSGVLTASRGGASLAVGATVTFSYEVTVTIASGTLTNNVEVDTDRGVGGALLDNNPNNNTASVATGVTASADLAMTKSITSGAGPFVAGATLGLRLAPRNLGQSAASSVVVRDVLPAQHTLAASFPLPPSTQAVGSYTCRTNAANQDDQDQADGGRVARTILRCTRASLPVGDTENIDFDVVMGSGLSGSVTNTASISASTADPSSANNSSSVSYTVQLQGADVELVNYSRGPATVAATGGQINNVFRVRNNGPQSVTANLQVFVALGASESLVSTGASWSCTSEAGGLRCLYTGAYPVVAGAVSSGGSFPDLTFVTQVNAAGSPGATACVGGSGNSAEPTIAGFAPGATTDFNTANDCSPTATVTASNQLSDLSLTKATSTPTGGDKIVSPSEDSVTYTMTVTNQGPQATPGVVLDDFLPGYAGSGTVVSICGFVGAGSCVPPSADNFPATIGSFSCNRSSDRVTCRTDANSLAVGAGNAVTFLVRMRGALSDSLSTSATSGCSSAGQFCNQAVLSIDANQPGASLDTNLNDNVARDTVIVAAQANIQTEAKTVSPAQAQVGVDSEYTINYRNPAASRSGLPAVSSPGAGIPAGVVFVDTFNLAANDAGFVFRSATIVSGAACTVAGVTGGVVAAAAAGGTSYSTLGGAAGTVRVECPAVTMPRNTDRQVRIVVRPNIGAVGPLVNTASFRIVDSGGNTAAANSATYDLNTDSSAGDDTKTASVNFVLGQVDLRVENTDLLDPATWDAAAVGTSPGASDLVYRVQVRNGGPALASNVRVDYTITPPAGGTIRFIGDEGGTAVTLASGATAPQRCVVQTGTNPVVAPATLTLRCSTPGFGFTPDIDSAIVQGTGAGDGAFLNIRLRFESTPLPLGSTVSTNAVVSAAETELDASNNAEPEVTTVRTTADLALSKTGFTSAVPALPTALPAAVAAVGLGQPFNWVLDLTNSGPGDSLSVDRSGNSPLNGTGTVITDTLPAGVTVTGPITWQKTGSSGLPGAVASGSGTCTLAGLAVTCNVGDVGSGGRVRVTLPVRWDTWPGGSGTQSDPQTNSASATSQTTDPVPSNNSTTHVVRVTRSSLAGVVFEDRDRAGANSGTPQLPTADLPLAGVTVALRAAGGVDAYGAAFTPRTTTTDSNGAYNFADLPAGTYELVQAQPAGYANSPGDPSAAAPGASPSLSGSYVAQGADPAGAPLPAGANSRYTGVVVGAQQEGVRYNFPELLQTAAISGTVFVDRNRDGSPGGSGAGEPGISGATLGLYPAGTSCPTSGALPGGALQTVSTDSNGAYSFSAGVPGTAYVICQQQPAGYGDRTPQPGSGNSTPGVNQINVAVLGAGGSTTNNFPEVLASLAGQVFADYSMAGPALTNNGVRDAGEPGIGSNTAAAGVPVTLSGTPSAGPNAGTALTQTTHTAADGSFAFDGLFPGSYTLTQGAIPAPLGSYTDGINTAGPVAGGGTAGTAGAVGDNAIRSIALAAGAQGTGNQFAELPPNVSIAGLVYVDANRDGALTGADTARIGGATLRLVSGLACTGTVLATTTTDSSGAYSFNRASLTAPAVLIPGAAYSVCQTQPAGFDDGSVNPGSGAAVGGVNHIVINALPATDSLANNFGEVTPVPGAVVISGTVFVDRNRDGSPGGAGAGEPGISGATLGLYPAGTSCPASGALPGGALQTVSTDSAGGYNFTTGLQGTAYVICQQQPAGYGDRTPQPGSGNSTPGANQINVAVLGAGGSSVNNFPEVLASLAGQVFADFSSASPALANNGVRDAGEPGIGSNMAAAGVPITLTGTPTAGPNTGTALTQTTHTAADGSFAFDGLFPGSYTLTQGAIPAPLGSYTDGINTAGSVAGGGTAGTAGAVGDNAIRNIALAAGAQGTGNQFAELPPAGLIGGTVFVDRNRDGSPGGVGEPGIAGATLGLYPAGTSCPASGALPGGALQTVGTDSTGAYSFTAGLQGTAYVICQQQPAGYGDRTPQPGSGHSTPGVNQINVAAFGAGGSTANHFPEVLASLAGQVFADFSSAGPALANNGVRDAGEPGIGSNTAAAGVPITLSGTPSAGPNAGTALTQTTHTAADGSFAFDGLFPGSYTLTQGAIPAPLGSYTDGINTAGPVAGGGTAGTAGAVGDNAIRNIVLAAGAQGTGNRFAELPPDVRIAGLVYVDANRDGSLTAADTARIGGATLRLVSGMACTGTTLATTTTDNTGAYSFNRASLTAPAVLIPGAAYSLCQTQPTGFDDGSVNPGSSAAVGGANHIVINALPATDSLANNFGEFTPAPVLTPDLVVTKALAPATFTELNSGSYTLTVRNAGAAASSGTYTVTDTLPVGITAVGTPTAVALQGAGGNWSCSVAGRSVTCTSSDVMVAGATHASAIRINVQVGQNLCSAGYPCNLDNVVQVSGGGEPPAAQPSPADLANPPLCSTPASQNVCRLPSPIQQSGGVSGLVWLDTDHDRRFTGSADIRQPGFTVELLQGGTLLRTATTDAQGQYQFLGLLPGSNYEIRFRDTATGAYYGRPVSTDPAGGNDPRASGTSGVVPDGTLRGFSVPGGNAVRVNQNLPLDPSGVLYDSQTRQPVGGALVELLGPGGQLVPAQCVLGGVNSITTAPAASRGSVPGGYAFWLVAPAAPACPGDGNYSLRVTPPAGYLNAGVPSSGSTTATSVLIPAQAGPLQVPANCAGYVQGAPCTVQAQDTPPTGAQPTPYYFTVPLSPNTPSRFVDIVNNHIPLDPLLGTRFVISKQASRSTVEVGDAVSYTITLRHLGGAALADVRVDDRLPAGFRYVLGTFKIGANLRADPVGAPGPNLRFDVGVLPINGQVTFTYITRAGVGAQQGDGINTAQATAGAGALAVQSNIAKARVRITGGVFGGEACVVGKVYVDCNNNQVQDREELGIPGVRLLLQDGTNITTDSEGKYSICGLPPRTHVLKADPLTLPRGSRLVTSSSRNAGDANSIFIDLKNGDLQRADFIEGSCSNTVLEQVKARRTQGEVRAVETEKKGGPALKFEGKAPNYPQQGTDSANQQPAVRPRENAPAPRPPVKEGRHEQNVPVPELPAASSNTQRPIQQRSAGSTP